MTLSRRAFLLSSSAAVAAPALPWSEAGAKVMPRLIRIANVWDASMRLEGSEDGKTWCQLALDEYRVRVDRNGGDVSITWFDPPPHHRSHTA